MTPGQRNAEQLLAFVDEATRRDLYKRSQGRLFATAVRLMIQHAPESSKPLTVDGLELRLQTENPFSPEITSPWNMDAKKLKALSVSTYRARVRHVLRDFRRWSDDLGAWQQFAVAKTSEPRQLPGIDNIINPLHLPSGRDAELRYPSDLSADDLGALSKVLISYANHLSVQALAMKGGSK